MLRLQPVQAPDIAGDDERGGLIISAHVPEPRLMENRAPLDDLAAT